MPGCAVGRCAGAGWHDCLIVVIDMTFASSFFKRPVLLITLVLSLMQHTVVVRIPCRAIIAPTEPARQCGQITRRGFYCAVHADHLLGLEVKASLVLGEPGAAGLGLFTTRSREAWMIVDEYVGLVQLNDVFNTQPSPFAVGISQGRVINSTRSSDFFARFANDARGTSAVNNCWLVSDRQYGLNWAQPKYADGTGGRVWLMTNRAVPQGEELLAEYGTGYWESRL